EENSGAKIEDWIQAVGVTANARLAQEALIFVRDEFGTYDWIMEGIIKRSGFRIDAAEYRDGFQTTYICTRE
ncbi:MAG: hypothetical protein NTY37_10625, partial [Methanothrix sp.]|nr:hypothetical protein [Methanothrix sp.]